MLDIIFLLLQAVYKVLSRFASFPKSCIFADFQTCNALRWQFFRWKDIQGNEKHSLCICAMHIVHVENLSFIWQLFLEVVKSVNLNQRLRIENLSSIFAYMTLTWMSSVSALRIWWGHPKSKFGPRKILQLTWLLTDFKEWVDYFGPYTDSFSRC